MDQHVAALRERLSLIEEDAVIAGYVLEGIEVRYAEAMEGAQVVHFPSRRALDAFTGVFVAYELLDLLSMRVPGPLSLVTLDQHVRLFDRIAAAWSMLPF